MLPCEGEHVSHRACVDSWLLELSSSCSIFQHDFHSPEMMLASDGRPNVTPHIRRASRATSTFCSVVIGTEWRNRTPLTNHARLQKVPMPGALMVSLFSNLLAGHAMGCPRRVFFVPCRVFTLGCSYQVPS